MLQLINLTSVTYTVNNNGVTCDFVKPNDGHFIFTVYDKFDWNIYKLITKFI